MTAAKPERAVLCARVSTRGQAEDGYTLRQQTEALARWCKREGYAMLEVVENAGHSGYWNLRDLLRKPIREHFGKQGRPSS